MKRLVLINLLGLMTFALQAQTNEFNVEVSGCLGLDMGSKYSVQLKAADGVRMGDFFVGAGAAFSYSSVLAGEWYSTVDEKTQDIYQTEFLLPVFARLRYSIGVLSVAPFIQVDCGWTFNVGGRKATGYSLPVEDGKSGGMPLKYKGQVGGLYLEPQIGVNIARNCYVALGFMMQNYTQRVVAISPLDAPGQDFEQQVLVKEMNKDNYMNGISIHIGLKF